MTNQPNPDRRTEMHLRRIEDEGGFCILPDNHEGECIGYPNPAPIERNDFGPAQAKNRRW
jgi:hypothetical protein